jgi:transposase InsO family protein
VLRAVLKRRASSRSALSKVNKEVFRYIEVYYNRKRPHSGISNLAPCEVEHNWHQEFDKELPYAE